MSPLDCARFQEMLAEALAAPRACGPEIARALQVHASACPACEGSLELVELALRPAGARDPFSEADLGYWDRFTTSLAARIERERGRRRARRLTGTLAAAAAAVIAAVVILRPAPFGSETSPALPPVDDPALGPDDEFEPFPAAGALGGFSEEFEPSLFSGADDLSAEDEERLLDWLRRERQRLAGGEA